MAINYKPVQGPDRLRAKRALVSVFDKSGIVEFAKQLAEYGIELISTGGTARALAEAGMSVTDIASVTEFPEILGGRVKTLHPAIHGGLLAVRNDPEHEKQMRQHGISGIDIVVTNLYPFEAVAASGAGFAQTVENIDIGGPAMIRAAAKNHAYVCVITDKAQYAEVIGQLASNGGETTLGLRRKLAAEAFRRTAEYDRAIADWFEPHDEPHSRQTVKLTGQLKEELRYGENPHQRASLYLTGDSRPGVATARQLQGKQLSYNNLNDADAAFELVSEFDPRDGAAVAIIKHANPCGVATAASLMEAYGKALACDPVSAFGGIVALNQMLDEDAAAAITELFTEVIIAPAVAEDAAKIIAGKKNLRLLITGSLADPAAVGEVHKSIAGGILVQSRDHGRISLDDLKVVTKVQPSESEMADMVFAFTVAKHVKSNAIVYVRDQATVGIGAGQMSRVDSARIAARKAEDAAMAAGFSVPRTRESVAASDAFFPFADGLASVVEAGARAVIQPGGSMRDDEVIAAADQAGIAMVFTGMRHFRH